MKLYETNRVEISSSSFSSFFRGQGGSDQIKIYTRMVFLISYTVLMNLKCSFRYYGPQ